MVPTKASKDYHADKNPPLLHAYHPNSALRIRNLDPLPNRLEPATGFPNAVPASDHTGLALRPHPK